MSDDALSVGAVARRLGVAVTTLRTWHQRYGLGPSRHVPGHHRRYTSEDLARLDVMRRLTANGVAPAEAARWAHGTPPVADSPDPTVRQGGGHVIGVGRAGNPARGLARAAMRMDAAAMRETMARAVARAGVVATWDDLIRPVLAGIGRGHALIEVEHLLSRCVSEVLGAVPRPPSAAGPPRILLACADEEQHSLPLEALAAALAEAGIPCRLLGARVPPQALSEAVRRTGPSAVVVWSHDATTGDSGQLHALLAAEHPPLLVAAAGSGWVSAPPDVARPDSLVAALALLTPLS
ncbi:MerR family transcriptional regulator [Actinomycetes bacterium KLBMP 9797]